MKILAIDPGTKRTGYAVLEVNGRSPELSECGCVFVRGKDLPERLLHIHKGIERLFRRHKPQHVVIERPFVGQNVRDAMTLNAGRAQFKGEDPGFLWRGKAKDYIQGKLAKYLDPKAMASELPTS